MPHLLHVYYQTVTSTPWSVPYLLLILKYVCKTAFGPAADRCVAATAVDIEDKGASFESAPWGSGRFVSG